MLDAAGIGLRGLVLGLSVHRPQWARSHGRRSGNAVGVHLVLESLQVREESGCIGLSGLVLDVVGIGRRGLVLGFSVHRPQWARARPQIWEGSGSALGAGVTAGA